MNDERVTKIVDRELRATIALNERGTLADVYNCPGHVAMTHDPKRCRYCGTNIEERD